MTPWSQWLIETTDGASNRDIARRTGVSHQTVGRWLNARQVPCHGIIAIARAYKTDPIDGMVAAGWLTEADLMNGGLRNAVRHAPTIFLTDELHQRALAGQVVGGFDGLRRMFRSWSG